MLIKQNYLFLVFKYLKSKCFFFFISISYYYYYYYYICEWKTLLLCKIKNMWYFLFSFSYDCYPWQIRLNFILVCTFCVGIISRPNKRVHSIMLCRFVSLGSYKTQVVNFASDHGHYSIKTCYLLYYNNFILRVLTVGREYYSV